MSKREEECSVNEYLHIWLKAQSYSLCISWPRLQSVSQQSAYGLYAILGLIQIETQNNLPSTILEWTIG